MSFWIRKYKLELDKLPFAVLGKSTAVVVLCIIILAAILLLLPIQDTIKGEVAIYTDGQPLTLQAPSSGFLNIVKSEQDQISRGDLIATIEVDVTASALQEMESLIYNDLAAIDFNNADELYDKVKEISNHDFRQIKIELYSLLDLLTQLKILRRANDPKELINTLDRSIQVKREQVTSFGQLSQSHEKVLALLKTQLESDSTLYAAGGISERAYLDRQRDYIDKRSIIIENNLRKQQKTGEIIVDEKEKFALAQGHRSKLEELKLRIVDQVSAIRSSYQSYLDTYVITSPINGFASLPFDIVDQEMITAGENIMLLSTSTSNQEVESEMFVDALNAGKIEKDMRVRIGLSEFNQREFGIYYTTVQSISEVAQDGKYKITLDCSLPLKTSYNVSLPHRRSYNGKGEIMIGKINLLTKISRELHFNRSKYASL